MSRSRVMAAGILSLAAFGVVRFLPSGAVPHHADAGVRAARVMELAIQAIRNERERMGAQFDLRIDPNRTGLIGPRQSPIATTAGELEAKRSTTNPNMAALLAYLLESAGVKAGDHVAIGSSGSFPALLVASLAAAKAMDLTPDVILSLGASGYGATDPDFNLFDIYTILQRQGVCSRPPVAVSLGGERDIGSDFEGDVADRMTARIQAAGVRILRTPDLVQNVAERMRIYRDASGGNAAVFINCGGAYANLGTSRMVLDVRPGLTSELRLPPEPQHGVLFAMSAEKIPVIHLLYVKGLVMTAGLPWDPIPLPRAESIRLAGERKTGAFWFVCAVYFGVLGILVTQRR